MSVASCWLASGCSSPLGNSRTQPTLPKAMLSPHQFDMRRGLWLLFPSEKLKPCHQLHRWVAAGVMKSLGQPHVKCAPILTLLLVDPWWPYTSEPLFGGAYFSVLIVWQEKLDYHCALLDPPVCGGYGSWHITPAIWLHNHNYRLLSVLNCLYQFCNGIPSWEVTL